MSRWNSIYLFLRERVCLWCEIYPMQSSCLQCIKLTSCKLQLVRILNLVLLERATLLIRTPSVFRFFSFLVQFCDLILCYFPEKHRHGLIYLTALFSILGRTKQNIFLRKVCLKFEPQINTIDDTDSMPFNRKVFGSSHLLQSDSVNSCKLFTTTFVPTVWLKWSNCFRMEMMLWNRPTVDVWTHLLCQPRIESPQNEVCSWVKFRVQFFIVIADDSTLGSQHKVVTRLPVLVNNFGERTDRKLERL